MSEKVVLIGWDAADWKAMRPLMDAGEMPGLEMLVNHGVMGNLTTLHPVLSPMLWTSIATGKRPYKHGIHGFSEPDPDGTGVRPISNLSRSTKAVWNILNQAGKRSIVVGWWPSHPAEPIDGVMVSDLFHRAPRDPRQPWPLRPETVHPERLAEPLAALRVHPSELVAEQLMPFVPRLEEIDLEKDRRPFSVAKTLAEAATVQAAATHLCAEEPWDFLAVYFDAIDHFGHGFMKYHPPRQDWIPERDYERYKDVMAAGYRFHDVMLQALLNLVDLRDTTVIIVSDHGFHPDHLRPRGIPKEPAGPAVEHREHGMFVACGPRLRRDQLIHGASLLDVTPTVLHLFGLPVGEDMDGEPLLDIYREPPEVETVASWDAVEGEAGTHPPGKRLEADDEKAAVDQLVALGYIEKPAQDGGRAVEETQRELDYNLAQSLMDAGRHAEAVGIFETLWRRWPLQHRFGVRLAFCYQSLGKTPEQRQVTETLLERRRAESEEARARLRAFHEVLRERKRERDGKEADPEQVEAHASAEARAAQERKALEQPEEEEGTQPLMTPKERSQYINMRQLARFSPYFMHYLLGSVCLDEGKHDEALEHLERAEAADPDSIGMHNLVGRTLQKKRRWADARARFDRVLELDPENPDAHVGVAAIALQHGKNLEAARSAFAAVRLRYHFPLAHYYLGAALERMDKVQRAIRALEVAVGQNPNHLDSHRLLEHIYADRLGRTQPARKHTRAIEAIGERIRLQRERPGVPFEAVDVRALVPDIEPEASAAAAEPDQEACTITVVSGLPRSGTSMMMQMLDAGGLPALTDGEREADADNPKGYYEFEQATRLRQDRTWLPQADGKVVKIVAQLLPCLPPIPHRYRIVFMERPIEEVLASQGAMLERQGQPGSKVAPEKLAAVFARQVGQVRRWMEQMQRVEVLTVSYRDVLSAPAAQANRIREFLELPLDSEAMAAVVDESLYRQRREAAEAVPTPNRGAHP